jgi:hypothetical protein
MFDNIVRWGTGQKGRIWQRQGRTIPQRLYSRSIKEFTKAFQPASAMGYSV